MVLCTRESREKGQNNGNHEPCQGFPYVVLASRTHTNTLHSTQSSHRFAACASQTVYSYIESAKDTRRIVLSYVSFVWFWLCDLCARTEHLAIMYVHFVHTAVLSCTLPCAGIMTYFGPKWNVFSIYILHQQCMITVCFFCFSCGAGRRRRRRRRHTKWYSVMCECSFGCVRFCCVCCAVPENGIYANIYSERVCDCAMHNATLSVQFHSLVTVYVH